MFTEMCEECGLPISEFDALEAHYDDSGVYHDGCYQMLVQQSIAEFRRGGYVRPSRAQIFADAEQSSFEKYGFR